MKTNNPKTMEIEEILLFHILPENILIRYNLSPGYDEYIYNCECLTDLPDLVQKNISAF